MSGDAEQEYFADGISEDIITALSKLPQLFVIARNSAFTFKGKNVNIGEVGRSLGVRHVLEGSVRKSGGRVRITAQLIDATTGGHLWAERFDRQLTDIFAVQDDVTSHIVSALALNLSGGDRRSIVAERTENQEAYDLFLRGRELWWAIHARGQPRGRAAAQARGRARSRFCAGLRLPRRDAGQRLCERMGRSACRGPGRGGEGGATGGQARRAVSLRAVVARHDPVVETAQR